ncbi:hypothetical protein RFI_28420, partial [Reticulomyxa filosa]
TKVIFILKVLFQFVLFNCVWTWKFPLMVIFFFKINFKKMRSNEKIIEMVLHGFMSLTNLLSIMLVHLFKCAVFEFETFRSSSKLINTLNVHNNVVYRIDYSIFDDCHLICSGSYDGSIQILDITLLFKKLKSYVYQCFYFFFAQFIFLAEMISFDKTIDQKKNNKKVEERQCISKSYLTSFNS